MASALSPPSTAGSEDPSKVDFLKEALYDAVKEVSSEERLWSQKDLVNLDIIPGQNVALLLSVINKLCSEMLFKPVTDGRLGVCWRWRSEEDAKKYVSSSNTAWEAAPGRQTHQAARRC